MIGAIAGDIIGSRFEWKNFKSKKFDLFTDMCRFTDDSVMSLAICDALLHADSNFSNLDRQAILSMQNIGRHYANCGFGGNFIHWIFSENPTPYHSYGNGSAMRVSGCGYVGSSIEEVVRLSTLVTEVTHNHPEGLKGAEATAVAVYLARKGNHIAEIREYIISHYYDIAFTLDAIRDTYVADVSCQGSVPQALQAFFESTDFEDAIRNAISLGGDSDTIAAITGSIAEAYYGVPNYIRQKAMTYLDHRLRNLLTAFADSQ